MPVERLDCRIHIHDPRFSPKRRRAVIQMAPQPLPAIVRADSLEAAAHCVFAHNLLHAQKLRQHAIVAQARDVGIALVPGQNREHRRAQHIALLWRVWARISKRAIGNECVEQVRGLEIFDEER